MSIKSFPSHLLTGLGIISLVAQGFAAQAAITAQLQPGRVDLGESARLGVTVQGSSNAEPNVPAVDGLEIVPVGQQSSMRSVNGVVSSNVTHLYQVTPSRAGSFTIPAIAAAGTGHTQPIAFHVDRGAGGPSQRTPAQNHPQFSPPGGSQDNDASVDAKGQSAFLRVVLPKQDLTVGELVPVEVKAYFRAGVSASLNGLPMLGSDAFALNKLSDQPAQSHESIDGVPYTVVTWTTGLSAIKAGDYPLNLDLPVIVRVKEKGKRSGRNPFKDFFGDDSPFGGSMFDDSFMDDFFGQTTEKEVTLHTDGSVVKIKALPTQGRPSGFSGAVGKFDIATDAPTVTGSTGDPLTLKITVTGHGNFARVSTPGLPASPAWKTYKPNAHFESADPSESSGTKTFEQSIVPMKAGAQEVPEIRFSYFDPDTQGYVTKTAAPIAVQIAQNSTAAPVPQPPIPGPAASAPATSMDGLVADEIAPAVASSSLRPLVRAPWFIVGNALLLAALAVGAILRALGQRRADDPQLRQRAAGEKAVSESLAAMDAALQAKDAPRFFDAARRALQERLAAQWQLPVSRVTLPEIRTRLNGHGEKVRAIFQAADQFAYSGHRGTPPDLQRWRDAVRDQLNQLARL